MNHVFPRHCKSNHPIAVHGHGVYLVDHNGKQCLDASGGAAVSCLGHGDETIIDAIKSQLDDLEFAHTGFLPAHRPRRWQIF